MTSPRTAPRTRRVICANSDCNEPFISKRRDATTCSDRCKKAVSRRARASAERLFEPKKDFKTVLRVARSTKKKSDWWSQWSRYDEHRDEWCRKKADALARGGVKGVRFIGTVYGIFAIEDVRGAVTVALNEVPWREILEDKAQLVECSPADPRLIKAVLPPLFGGGWRDRKQDERYRAMLLDGVSRVILFSIAFEERPTPVPSSARPRAGADCGDEGRRARASYLHSVFPGGGYSIK